jgi:predicted aspartyl protease
MIRSLAFIAGGCALLAGAAYAANFAPVDISAAPASSASCQQVRIAGVDMVTEADGLVAVPVLVDDTQVMLTVDTGAIHTAISSRLADTLGLDRNLSSQSEAMVGGVAIAQMAYAHSLKMGPMATGRVGVMVAPSQALNADTDGLFGPDVMDNYDVEIDYAHGRFALFSQDHCPGQVVYWTHEPYARVPMHVDESAHISVPVTLDGKPVTAFIDTGAERSIMTLGVARSLFGIVPGDPRVTKRENVSINDTAPTTIYHYPFAALALEGITVQHPDIDIMPDSVFGEGGGPQLIVGAGVLRQLHLYLAYKEQVLYATPAESK